jgi:hypothetical protein
MTSTGQLPNAINALTGMADRMRPELTTRADELLSLYGMLYLAASIAAAKQEDAETALIMHEQAHAAAENLGPHYETHQTVFGLTNVALHRLAALVRLHEPGQALEYAPAISTRARSRFFRQSAKLTTCSISLPHTPRPAATQKQRVHWLKLSELRQKKCVADP